MLELRRDPDLPQEPLGRGDQATLALEDLDGHPPLEPQIAAQEDDGHPPAAELVLN